MRRTVLQALLTLTGIAALAIATSCYSEQSDEFQVLEPTGGVTEKFLNITASDTANANHLWGTYKLAQKFTTSKRFLINGALVKLVKYGTWVDYTGAQLIGQIYKDDTGNDRPHTDYVSNNTQKVNISSISDIIPSSIDDYIPFEFTTRPTLDPGTYWLVIKLVDTDDGDLNDYILYYTSASGGGLNASFHNGSWNTTADNLSIVMYGTTVP